MLRLSSAYVSIKFEVSTGFLLRENRRHATGGQGATLDPLALTDARRVLDLDLDLDSTRVQVDALGHTLTTF